MLNLSLLAIYIIPRASPSGLYIANKLWVWCLTYTYFQGQRPWGEVLISTRVESIYAQKMTSYRCQLEERECVYFQSYNQTFWASIRLF